MKPICIPCQRFFRMVKSGFYFVEGMPVGPGTAPAGTAEPGKWKPYKIWSGDRWRCPGCNAEIISGVAQQPTAEHYEQDFNHYLRTLNATQFQVNDC